MDGSLKNKALKIFEKEQTQLDSAFVPQSPDVVAPKKLEKVTVVQNADGSYSKNVEEVDSNVYDDSVVGKVEAEIKNDAATLQEFCKEFDNRILSFNAQINAKKEEIVTLSAEAIARNCWPGIAYTALTAGGGTRPVVAITSNFGNPYDVIEDREALEIYDKMAGPSVGYGTDNPFEPTRIVTLTSSYSGFGHETQKDNGRLESGDAATEVLASDYNIGGGDEDNDPYLTSFQSSSTLGTGRDDVSVTSTDHQGPRIVASAGINTSWWYAGVGVAPDATNTSLTGTAGENRCVAIASSISTLISEIQTLRSQRDAAINRANINIVKDKKMNKELQNWGAENVKAKQTQRKTSNSSAISAVKSMD
jgi:hypothetical protein